jgi:hypothetical protein
VSAVLDEEVEALNMEVVEIAHLMAGNSMSQKQF